MHTRRTILFRSGWFLGALLLLLPIAGVADGPHWKHKQITLEHELTPGESPWFYHKQPFFWVAQHSDRDQIAGADWSVLPPAQTSLLLFRETDRPAEPIAGHPDPAALQQRVDRVFQSSALPQPYHAVTVSVREDGGVVLDGTVGSLGAALAAYEAVGTAEATRYVIVDLDILGSQAHEARLRQPQPPGTLQQDQPQSQPQTAS